MAAACEDAQEGGAPVPPPAFDALLEVIEADFLCGALAANGYDLHPACQPTKVLIKYLEDVLSGGSTGNSAKDWRCVMNKRIGISYKERPGDLVWLDDKFEQVSRTAALFQGRELHLPIYSHAAKGDATALGHVCQQVQERAAAGEALVLKPRHGSNSKHVFLWPRPQDLSGDEILDSAKRAADSYDKSWDKESWNQNAVPKGVVLQPMYAPLSRLLGYGDCTQVDGQAFARGVCPKFLRPLELKVQVLFGEVVGAQLNTHPQYLWVSRDGRVHIWDQSAPGFVTRHSREPEQMPSGLVRLLVDTLREHWHAIRGDSERLARTARLDELRVDWLLCDPLWGPRIGELTYLGTFAIDILPVSVKLARAFAHGHLSRVGPVLHAC